jgi:hypothetical protein
MIPSFDDQTSPLTEYERDVLLPMMIRGLKTKIGVEKCITNPQICKALKELGHKISEPRVRKIVFHIRHNNLIPKLIASSKGYWIATNKNEVELWLSSIQSRLSAMLETEKYAQQMLNDWTN